MSRRDLKAPRVRILKDGVEVPPSEYFAPNEDSSDSSTRLSAIRRFLASGATLLYNDAWGICDELDDLRAAFESVLGWHCELDILACNSHVNGLPLHMDANDCFAIQVIGAKQWTIYPPTRQHPLRRSKHFPARTDAWPAPRPLSTSPAQTFVITAGDVLYIPRGWWHFVQPLPGECLSINPTVYTPTAQDFLRWIVEESTSETELRRGLVKKRCDEEVVAPLRNLLIQHVSPEGIRRYYETLEADHACNERARRSSATTEQMASLPAECYLRWSGSALAPIVHSAELKMFRIRWQGTNHYFSQEHYPVLARVLSQPCIQMRELLADMSRAKRAQTRIFLVNLIELGLVTVSSKGVAQSSIEEKAGGYEAAEHDNEKINYVG